MTKLIDLVGLSRFLNNLQNWLPVKPGKGDFSCVEGSGATASGDDSHAEGYHTITNNAAEHAEGSCNKSNKASDTYGDAGNTQHSVGIGTSNNDRKNAFEIMQNGDAYLYGVGRYNGTNPGSYGVKTLQSILTKLVVHGVVENNEFTPDSGEAGLMSAIELLDAGGMVVLWDDYDIRHFATAWTDDSISFGDIEWSEYY